MPLVNAFGNIALDQTIKDAQSNHIPSDGDIGMNIRAVPAYKQRIGFANVISGSIDPSFGSVLRTGTGQTVNQSGGNLLVTTGTTINQDTIIRANVPIVPGGMRLKWKMTLSQRIVNQNFEIALVDVIGDGLATTISSATAITVTKVGHGFTAQQIGHKMDAGAYTGTGTFPVQTLTIASIPSVDTITFTGAGMAAGTGTISLFGYNFIKTLYTGTTATNANFDVQRKGWNAGAVTATINTTASPGHIAVAVANDGFASFFDMLPTSLFTAASRVVRSESVPDDIDGLRIQIRVWNGTVAPASTTTMTLGLVSVENFSPLDTTIQDLKLTNSQAPLEVAIQGTPAVTVSSGSITVSSITAGAVTNTPTTGALSYAATTAASTNSANIKATSGTVYVMTVSNVSASAMYVKLYNKATSAPTVGTDLPVVIFPCPANATQVFEFGALGDKYTAGIGIAVTGAAAATDTSNAALGALIKMTYL